MKKKSPKPKPYNPLELVIGQVVQIDYYCEVIYNENERIIHKLKTPNSVTRIIGVVKKALGEYISGHTTYSTFGDPDEYEQPSLSVSKYVWLYQTRIDIKAPIKLVHPEDILTAIG